MSDPDYDEKDHNDSVYNDSLNVDDDDYDPSQPLPPSKFFGSGSGSGSGPINNKPEEEEKFQDQEYHNNNDGGDDGGSNNGGGNGNNNNNNNNGPSNSPSVPDLDALTAADSLPTFANQEVRVLDAAVKAKERLLQKFIDEEEENKERVAVMAEHLKNVKSERLHSQQLLDAKDRDIQTELHLKQLAEREAGRVTTDISKVEKAMHDAQDKLNSIQNNHFVATETLEQFKQQMNWNQEELLQWSLAAKQKDEDRAALEKYAKTDEVKLKHLILKNENMARLEQEKKQQLDQEITETQAIQIELDKTAEEYKRQHQSKQELIKQWDESEIAMQKRDQAIAQVSEQITSGKKELRAKEALVAEQKEFLQQEQQNNKQLNISIGMYERVSEKTRNELNGAKKELIEFEDEVATQRSELEKAESELKLSRVAVENFKQQKDSKLQRTSELAQAVAEAKHALETEYSTTDNLADRASQVDVLHKEHVTRLAQQNKTLQQLKESMFKHSHELFQKRKAEADLIAEISGAQGTSRNLQQRIHELDQRSLKQQEMLYNIEFQVQQLERKVSHASGKRSLEDTMALNQQILQLQEQLSQMKQQDNIIGNQVKKLQEDLRAAKRAYREKTQQRDQLLERISRIELENESSDRELKECMKKKEELIVSHDILKLEVKRLREQLATLADQVLQHENRRAQLQLSMREREREVELHSEVQKAEVKGAEEARHGLARDLKERQIKVEKLQKKYETIAGKLHKQDELPNGEEHSQAYYIIAAAQEREELQREGDELNREIRQCETEVAALNNTQAMLNGRNQLYRAGLQKPDPEGSDAALKVSLEEQQRAAVDKLYKHRAYLREITSDFEERRNILAQLLNSIGNQQSELQSADAQTQAANKALADQTAQLQRATNHMMQKRNEYRRKTGVGENDESVEELYMNLQEQKRKNAVMLGLLQEFAESNVGTLGGHVGETLEEMGIRLSRPVSAASSRASSSRSHRPDSAASVRSSRPMSSASQASVTNGFGVRGVNHRPPSGQMGVNGSVMLPSINSPHSQRSSRPQSRANH